MSAAGNDLDRRLEELAREAELLVASDFDGTLAPIAEDPRLVSAEPGVLACLQGLAEMPRTHAAVISGRALRDLASLTGLRAPVRLVGSHGSEFDAGFGAALTERARELLDVVAGELTALAARHEGFLIERKPASAALHYRHVPEEVAARTVEDALAGPGARRGVTVRHGKKVVELLVVATTKGDALRAIRDSVKPSATIFIGDDDTDEHAFEALGAGDVGVKVGPGRTAARHRVAGTPEVARLIGRLAELRGTMIRRTTK